jgi:protein-disulfide isomerase
MKDGSKIISLTRPVGDGDHVLGPQSAAATLIEYGDYECPYCRQLHPMIQEIVRRTEGLRFVYRHFPISKVHPHAARAAEAAEAAGAQDRFWQMHDVLFEQGQPLDEERLARSARKAKLDMERYTREMTEGAYSSKVEEDIKSALYGDHVTGTPTLYLNGVLLSSIHGFDDLLAAVTEAGATLRADPGGRTDWLTRLRKFRVGITRLHL